MAKKKLNAKERKQLQQANQQAKNADRVKAAKAKKEAEREAVRLEAEKKAQEKRQRELQKIEEKDSSAAKVKKSNAKAAGLKSAFVLDEDRVLVTSFANGNTARREKHVEGGQVSDIASDGILTLETKESEKKYHVYGRTGKDALPDDPMYYGKKAGDDLIHLRDKLETMFFGKTFQDNIHIQLAYNILDIEKVLAVFANNIIFEMNNMRREPEQEEGDVMGSMGFERTYEMNKKNNRFYPMFDKLLHQPQLGYFGDTLLLLDEKGKKIPDSEEAKWEAHRKRCYYLLEPLAMVRQATAHGDFDQRSMLFRLETNPSGSDTASECIRESRKELDKIYKKRIQELNSGFFDKSGARDLPILFKIYQAENDDARKKLAREYYQFLILKSYKFLGFSIKRLREVMIGQEASYIAEDQYNSVRNKLNHLLDFMICRIYQDPANEERLNKLVDGLRSSMKESEKTLIYMEEAKNVWFEIGQAVDEKILPKMTQEYLKSITPVNMKQADLGDVTVTENAHEFSKMIYLMTIFLDGKEINDLMTQLINRFDNIRSFLEVMAAEGLDCTFTEHYQVLSESEAIVEELRVINSFARMSKEAPNVKKELFIEAAEVLGFPDDDEKLRSYAEEVFDKEKGLKKANGKKDNGFRNFIINNVIESDRFRYLIRYGNPKKVRKLAENRTVIMFVLKGIPDEQIRFYYNSCNDVNRVYSPDMREDLADRITGLNFDEFSVLASNSSESAAFENAKERKKNIVRLYLTVLYLLQKNLVNINSRYYTAFHCAERDAMICDPDKYTDKVLKADRGIYARDFYDIYTPYSGRARDYVAKNISNADVKSWTFFRNCTEHLNVVRDAYLYMNDIRTFDSYFELYHYLVQRFIMDECTKKHPHPAGKLPDYFRKVTKYRTYCKDFVKALNVPFAYNLPRYKNLSINELFDRNHYLEDRKKMYEELKHDD